MKLQSDLYAYRSKPRRKPNPELTPLSASEYFAQALQVAVPASKLDVRIYYTPPKVSTEETGTVMMCHHGAGFSGLSFACFAKEVAQMSGGECGVLSVDARRHGEPLRRM